MKSKNKNKISNILSFDLEEWFQTNSLGREYNKWRDFNNSRIKYSVDIILQILNKYNVKATFFVVGRLAERNPDLIKKISNQGHEIASHGYSHRFICQQTHKELEDDLKKSKNLLEDITGRNVLGYRAPGYSITKDTLWALNIIKDCGLKYDSSIYPVSLKLFTRGGISGYPEGPFFIKDNLLEFPLSTLSVLGLRIPVATTAYFRIFPYQITKWAINKLNKRGIMATLNFHSWEFDENQPKVKLSFPYNIKHFYNLPKTQGRFKKLLADFRFLNCKEALDIIELHPETVKI